jgi:hypothetical protein
MNLNLICCENCGIVLNKEVLKFPDPCLPDGTIDDTKAMWNGDGHVAFILCPVCKARILEF